MKRGLGLIALLSLVVTGIVAARAHAATPVTSTSAAFTAS